MISATHLARRLGRSVPWVYMMIKREKFVTRKVNGVRMIEVESVLKAIE